MIWKNQVTIASFLQSYGEFVYNHTRFKRARLLRLGKKVGTFPQRFLRASLRYMGSNFLREFGCLLPRVLSLLSVALLSVDGSGTPQPTSFQTCAGKSDA